MQDGLNGVLVVDKPAGPTSHDVVDRVRRALHERRIGHTGTLDPFATGVLVLCVGQATRLARFLTQGEKTYEARVRLGQATDTDDCTGEPLGAERPVAVSRARLLEALAALTGEIGQVPPAFSAKSVGGRRLYELARRGVAVERAPSVVSVYALDLQAFESPELALVVRCSAGTYVRALARDLGEALGTGAHLIALRRTCSSGFGLEQAVPGGDLAGAAEQLVPMRELLKDLPAVRLSESGQAALRHGQRIVKSMSISDLPDQAAARVRFLSEAGELLGLGLPGESGEYRPEIVFPV